AHPNGTVYQDGILQGNYSFWWIHVPNVLMMFGVRGGEEYPVIDPTGFLGSINSSYNLIVTRKMTYWPTNTEQANLLGAQSSFEVNLYDKTTDRVVATATFDITCGIIEVWEGSHAGFNRLTLIKTDFPMSRNRIIALVTEIIYGIILVAGITLLMSKKWDNESLARFTREPGERNEIALLVLAGVLAIIVDIFVDVWFYLPLGMWGNIILHAGYTIFLGLICWTQKYRGGYQWLAPSILEISFVLALNLVTGDPYVPPLTAFMGSTISWVALIWASGIEKYKE
ncbi:MAG: hypothetical protein ACFFD4_38320, partial [Candidatus Odinarchaeota archaeon]